MILQGIALGVIKGDTRSLDYSSHWEYERVLGRFPFSDPLGSLGRLKV